MKRTFFGLRLGMLAAFAAMLAIVSPGMFAADSGTDAVTLEQDLERSDVPPAVQAAASDPVPEEAFQQPPIPPPPPLEPLIQEEEDSINIGPSDDAPFPGADSPEATRAADAEVASTLEDLDRDFGDSPVFSFLGSLAEFFQPGAGGGPDERDNFRVTLAGTVGYDDNVLYASQDPEGSATSGVNGSILYDFGSERFQLSSRLSAGVTYYDNRQDNPSDNIAELLLSLSYQPNRRLTIDASIRAVYQSQPDPLLVGSVTRFSGDYYYTDDQISFRYQLRPRLAAILKYRFNGFRYVEEASRNQDFYQQIVSIGFEHSINPRTALTTEYRYNPVDYYEADFGSVGQIFTVGFIHSLTPRMLWNFQAGGEYRELTSGGVATEADNYLGPFLETNLSYQFAPKSVINGNLRFGTEPTGVSSLVVKQTLRASLSANHAFTGRFSGFVGLTYQHQNFDQPGDVTDFSQEIYTAYAGLRFQLNAALAVTGNYSYTIVETPFETSNYTRGITTLGLEVIF